MWLVWLSSAWQHQRQAAPQALQRQAVAGVDARRAQDADAAGAAEAAPEAAQAALRHRRAVPRAPTLHRRPRFVDPGTTAIAIHPAGADVDQAPW
jgi:hypothetical protein